MPALFPVPGTSTGLLCDSSGKNPISQLYEWCQRAHLTLECTAASSGPPHELKWRVQWLVAGQPMPPDPVVDHTKNAARERAARFALDALLLATMPPVVAPPTRPSECPRSLLRFVKHLSVRRTYHWYSQSRPCH